MVTMRSAYGKDLFREIRKSIMRFLSIFSIVLLGVAFFAGIKATAPDMKNTADKYYDDYNMMDIDVFSTLGLTDGDICAIRSADGVEQVVPTYFADGVCTVNATEYVFRMHCIPAGGPVINGVKLTQGRMPERSGECLVEDQKDLDLGLKIGDRLTVSSGKHDPIVGNALKTDVFTIVGKAVTPLYLCYDKGSSDIGNGKVSFFMMIPEADFAYPAYTEALITVKGARQLDCYGADYANLIDRLKVTLENMGIDRSAIRLNEIKGQAEAQLNAAKQEYSARKKEFDEKMAASAAQLNQSQMELGKAEATLLAERENHKRSVEQAKAQIELGRRQLEEGEKDYQKQVAEYNRIKRLYGTELKQFDSIVRDLNSLDSMADDEIAELWAQVNGGGLSEEERVRMAEMIILLDSFKERFDKNINSVTQLNRLLRNEMNNAGDQLKQARKQLDDGYRQLSDAEKQLEEGEREAAERFAQAEKDIAAGWAEYETGKEQYEQGKRKGEVELAAGQEKIVRAEDEIDRISKPQWYVLDRNSNISYVDFSMTAGRIDSLAKAFPVFFFLVAALVCLTTMTRMVDEQRGVIGIYKALGYQDKAIAAKYIAYAAIASTLGAAAGLAAGVSIFPEVIYRSWLMKYTMPPLQTVPQPWLMASSLVMGVLVTTLTAWAACRRELMEAPATLMRPRSPKAGKRILLERVTFLWRRLSFSQKVTARNIFRYKKRFLMTVIGISGCTALLLAGFGLGNSIGQVVDRQFNEIFAYDMDVRFSAGADEAGKKGLLDMLQSDDNVSSGLACTELNAKTRSEGEDIAVTLVVPADADRLPGFIMLRDSASRQPIPLDQGGAVITEKLSKELSVGVGDAIELDNGLGSRKKVIVTAITENYIFHYVYMSAPAYREIYRLDPQTNGMMICLKDDSPGAENGLASKLIAKGGVASVTFYSNVAASFRQTVKSLNTIILVIVLCAGLLAFIVLYNLTNINIGERVREIATVKVLGFWHGEVSAYVFRENITLSVLGALIGMPLGVLLHRYIMASIEQSGIMFGNYMSNLSYLWAFLITMAFTGLVIFAMNFKLIKIPMVESLKSVE